MLGPDGLIDMQVCCKICDSIMQGNMAEISAQLLSIMCMHEVSYVY